MEEVRTPLVSVVIHSFDRFNYLMNAIDSVKNQSYKNFELILINDDSNEKEYYEYKFPLIDEENETMTYGEGGNQVSIVSLELQSRLPSIHNTKKSQDYKDYLINQRMIDSSIIEREFNTKEIKTGSFYSHENYMYGSIGLFTLKYFDNEYKKTYERFSFDQEGKLNRGHLSNIPIKGRSHIIKNEGAKATIFTEAVIDNYSMENFVYHYTLYYLLLYFLHYIC